MVLPNTSSAHRTLFFFVSSLTILFGHVKARSHNLLDGLGQKNVPTKRDGPTLIPVSLVEVKPGSEVFHKFDVVRIMMLGSGSKEQIHNILSLALPRIPNQILESIIRLPVYVWRTKATLRIKSAIPRPKPHSKA